MKIENDVARINYSIGLKDDDSAVLGMKNVFHTPSQESNYMKALFGMCRSKWVRQKPILTLRNTHSLSIESGASSVEVKLGDLLSQSDVRIESGASHTSILVPKSITCKVSSKEGLSKVNAVGFTRLNDSEYISTGTVSDKSITIRIEVGLSSVDIERY